MAEKRVWTPIKEYSDILFDYFEGIARITINRPQIYNAFRPDTNEQMLDALDICRNRADIGVVVGGILLCLHVIFAFGKGWKEEKEEEENP